jgi:hypothetical protein
MPEYDQLKAGRNANSNFNDNSFHNMTFNYTIFDSENKLIRKGQFKGLLIQLRLSHLTEGRYTLQLFIAGQDPAIYSIAKKSPGDENEMMIHVY